MDEPDEEDLEVKPYTLEEFSYEHFRWSSLCSMGPRKVLGLRITEEQLGCNQFLIEFLLFVPCHEV